MISIYSSDKEKYKQLDETIRMLMELKQKKYIRSDIFVGSRVTFRGQLYRLYMHPSLSFWGIVIAVVVAFLIYLLQS